MQTNKRMKILLFLVVVHSNLNRTTEKNGNGLINYKKKVLNEKKTNKQKRYRVPNGNMNY